jgi:hypothetical protein
MGRYDVPQKATAAVKPRPVVVAMTPDDAMALSIELQKAAIDAAR